MELNETILFVSQVKMITRSTTVNNRSNILKTGLTEKKIVVTNSKMYVFESPHTDIASTEFRVKKDKERPRFENKEQLKKQFYSITGTPLQVIQIAEKDCKIILNEDERFKESLLKTVQALSGGISTKNLALLVTTKTRKVQHFFFSHSDAAIRFARSIKAANAWINYTKYCMKFQIPTNIEWSIFLQDYVYNSDTIFVIDPMHYQDGVNEEIQMDSFCVLVDQIQNVAGLKFKFVIKEEYGFQCLKKFMKSIQTIVYMRRIILSECQISDESILVLSDLGESLKTLTNINLSHNKLSDGALIGLRQLLVHCVYLKNINLSHNLITFLDSDNFSFMLKAAKQYLILNLSNNNISDQSILFIEGTIIFSTDIPLQEIDFSFNKFTKYGEWRIYVGSMRSTPHIKFILYPLHFHMEIFKFKNRWPIRSEDTLSSLSSQTPKGSYDGSIRDGMMSKLSPKNTDKKSISTIPNEDIVAIIGIKIKRNVASNKAPAKSEDLEKINKIKSQLTLMINSKNASLQRIYEVSKEINSYEFSFPTIALQEISQELWSKMQTALRVRDHEAIQLIAESCSLIGVNINGYKDRLVKVDLRKDLFCKRLYMLFNFQMDQMELVPELEELIKQSLRLCLKGTAIDLLYYLKFLKDQKIKTFIKSQYSPYVQLQGRRTESYAKLFEKASESKQKIPNELRMMKNIDVNLYDYYLYVNYFLLAITSRQDYEKSVIALKSMLPSDSTFSKFIYLALQRINFIMTEFYKSFIYSAFSISYLELKINSCRMVWQYQNIKKSVLYSDLFNFPKKTPITPEKNIKIPNEEEYTHVYSLDNYENIKIEARQYGIHLYKAVFTRYVGKLFVQQVKKLCQFILKFFESICNSFETLYETSRTLLELIQFMRGCTHVNELLEELYVHIICFKGNEKEMSFLEKVIPIMTMYLRPPETIEGYLIAYLIKRRFSFSFKTLSVVFQRRPTSKYVDRDWTPTQKQMVQLISNGGRLMVPIRTTEKKIRFIIAIEQSKIVGDLMLLVYEHNVLAEYIDKATFWIYKHNLQTSNEEIILFDDYIGELISNYNEDKEQFIIRRRIYSPYYMMNYQKYTDSVLNSIYHEVRHFYLLGVAYTVFDDSESYLAAIIAMVDILEQSVQNSKQINFEEDNFALFTEGLRDKIAQIVPVATRNTRTFKIQTIINEIKEKIKIELEHPNITVMKLQRKFLDEFRNHHYYCSSNYQARLAEQSQKCLVSVNSQFICVETITDQKNIFYESILSLCPEDNNLNIYYYDKEKLETIELVLETKTRISIAIVMDVVSYCVLRLYTSSVYIYLQRELHEMMFKYDYPLSAFDPDKQERGEEYIISSLKHRRGQSNASVKQIISNINHLVGRLRTMDLLSFKETDFIFQQQIKFSKWELDREVFPFKSERILQKSEKTAKENDKFAEDSNWEAGSVNTSKKQNDFDNDSFAPKGDEQIMDEIAELNDEEGQSPLLRSKKPIIYNKQDDSDDEQNLDKAFDIEPVFGHNPDPPKPADTKVEIPKLEIPRREIPPLKRHQELEKPTVPTITRQLPKIEEVSESPMKESQIRASRKFQQERQVPPTVPNVVISPVVPQEPIVPPIPEPIQPTVVQPVLPPPPPPPIYTPPPVPPIQPASTLPVPQEANEQVVSVIKPRNSNPAYGRASRRRV